MQPAVFFFSRLPREDKDSVGAAPADSDGSDLLGPDFIFECNVVAYVKVLRTTSLVPGALSVPCDIGSL